MVLAARKKEGAFFEDADQYLQAFLEQAPVILFVVDRSGNILLSEGKGLSVLKLIPGELVGQNVFDVYGHLSWAMDGINKVFETKCLVSSSGPVERDLWFDVQFIPVKDFDGTVRKAVGVAVDVTERKNFDLVREQQISALEASIDGLGVLDVDGNFIYMNEAHARIYGYQPGELLGQKWELLYAPQELSRFQNQVMPTLYSAGNWRGDAIGMRKDGTCFAQEVSLSKVRGGGLVCVVRDVSQRRQTEQQQNLLSDLNRELAESIDYTDTIQKVLKVAVPGFSSYCLLCLNPVHQFEEQKILQTCEEEDEALLQEMKIFNYERPDLSSYIANYLPTQAPEVFKRLKIHSLIFVPLKVRGGLIGNVAFLRSIKHPSGPFSEGDHQLALNISHRAALAIENSRLFFEARQAVDLQETLMATVSHDLKNPLLAVGINAELLTRFANKPGNEILLQKVSRNIKASVDQMGSLIRHLLEFDRVRTGRVVPDKRSIQLSLFIPSAITIFSSLAEKKSLRFEVRIDISADSLMCDPEKLTQVLSNLIGNAIKFTNPPGLVRLTVHGSKTHVQFDVIDTGPGIRPEELRHVFELYWQSKKTRSQGTGLGLAIARGIVEAHGGKIWADSKFGAGSTFSFSIPRT